MVANRGKKKKKLHSNKDKKFVCKTKGDSYMTKWKCNLRQRRANVYNEGAVWRQCPGCDVKAKHKGNLKKHFTHIHNIDVR